MRGAPAAGLHGLLRELDSRLRTVERRPAGERGRVRIGSWVLTESDDGALVATHDTGAVTVLATPGT